MKRHEILKRGWQEYIPPSPTLTATSVFHFNMISLLVSNAVPLSGLPLWFPWSSRGCAHFLLGRQNRPCSARCLGHMVMLEPSPIKLPSVSDNQIFFSVRILVSETLTVLKCDLMSFFCKRSREIFRDPPGNVEIFYIFLSKTLQTCRKAKPCLPFRCVNIHK